ncbi:hypothetical protein ACWESL_21305 [Streptosporangium sandarakinum]
MGRDLFSAPSWERLLAQPLGVATHGHPPARPARTIIDKEGRHPVAPG